MKINSLKPRPEISNKPKLQKVYTQFEKLIDELRIIVLPEKITVFINASIDELNLISNEKLRSQTKKKQSKIISLIEKELKIVPINHYRNTWMAIGMSAFGVPLGVALGASLGNMGFIAIGLPIGMAIGLSVGTSMDKKAQEEGRQLNMEVKF
ncbi:hypothetical protein [Cyclobacterium amurskyense]|uniref:Glycine zipper family protein n=1 Tax=Cyclobacterium amurskyense TaxID=320787 RepID=A0A0H4PCN1_9BACT|nr:hypothetical protein [Cyclobacterium amurskyense]AKP50568.1 hypothetical protein CA2015_1119 [Cyclobacterium amurskyense]|tara:strand:+ start:870 stop:1328 length:459 start_codon:yes stop_codon:yes gene_type:complete